jgi:hypothetical protein
MQRLGEGREGRGAHTPPCTQDHNSLRQHAKKDLRDRAWPDLVNAQRSDFLCCLILCVLLVWLLRPLFLLLVLLLLVLVLAAVGIRACCCYCFWCCCCWWCLCSR